MKLREDQRSEPVSYRENLSQVVVSSLLIVKRNVIVKRVSGARKRIPRGRSGFEDVTRFRFFVVLLADVPCCSDLAVMHVQYLAEHHREKIQTSWNFSVAAGLPPFFCIRVKTKSSDRMIPDMPFESYRTSGCHLRAKVL